MLDYREEIKKLLLNSVNELRNDIDSNWVNYKVENYCDRWGDSIVDVKKKILTDDRFARFFIKDPKRRNIYEKLAIYYLSNVLKKDIVKLSAGGSNALCIKNGEIIKGSSTTQSTKSIDFKEERDGKIYYYTHKYIESDGGAQDNQYRDMCHFADEATKYVEKHDDNVNFILLADGSYFDRKDRKNKINTGHRVEIKNINEL